MSGRRLVLLAYLGLLAFGVWHPHPLPPADALAPAHLALEGLVSDAIRNVVLFLPLGALLAAEGCGIGLAVAIGLALSGLIELVQTGVPGRYPSAIDLATNALGVGLGAALFLHRRSVILPSPDTAQRLAALGLGLLLTSLAAGTWLLGPSFGGPQLYAGWTPTLGHYETYRGRVEDVRIGDERLGHGPVADSEALRRRLAARAPIAIEATLEASSGHPAPIFTLHDGEQREILAVVARGSTLFFIPRVRAHDLGFEQPSHRFRHALPDTGSDDSLHRVTLYPEPPAARLEIDGAVRRSGPWRAGRIWSLLLPDRFVWPRFDATLDILALSLLAFPWLYYERSIHGRRTRLGALAVVVLLFLLPRLGPVAYPGLAEIFGLGFGGALALAAREGVARLVAEGHLGCTEDPFESDSSDRPTR